MPTETVIVLVFVGLIFAIFAAGVTYADLKTREFRD
jgi:hypothetical protein